MFFRRTCIFTARGLSCLNHVPSEETWLDRERKSKQSNEEEISLRVDRTVARRVRSCRRSAGWRRFPVGVQSQIARRSSRVRLVWRADPRGACARAPGGSERAVEGADMPPSPSRARAKEEKFPCTRSGDAWSRERTAREEERSSRGLRVERSATRRRVVTRTRGSTVGDAPTGRSSDSEWGKDGGRRSRQSTRASRSRWRGNASRRRRWKGHRVRSGE